MTNTEPLEPVRLIYPGGLVLTKNGKLDPLATPRRRRPHQLRRRERELLALAVHLMLRQRAGALAYVREHLDAHETELPRLTADVQDLATLEALFTGDAGVTA